MGLPLFILITRYYPYILLAIINFITPFLVRRILYPYILHPNRVYSNMIGTIKYPWRPPFFLVGGWLIHLISFYFLRYWYNKMLQVQSLKRCNKRSPSASKKTATRLAMIATIIHVVVSYAPPFNIVPFYLQHTTPFAAEAFQGAVLAGLMTFMFWTYQAKLVINIC